MDQLWTSLVSIATAIVGVAILALIVSKNSNTSGVINAATQGFGYDLGVAVSPVTGGGVVNGFSNNSFDLNGVL